MATITSATSGLYGTGATWVGGIAPVEGDKVIIARTSTALETFSTDTAGYAIGATAITLTGAVAAGSYVIGESVQFGSDPNYYTITNWNSATKVLTVSPLIVAIPASATLVKAKGHVVTVDGTYIAGDDTTSAFTVNGTLLASRTVNSSLTIKGDLVTAATIAATIDYGNKTLGDTIPSSVTATLILNYSAALVFFKYGMFIADTSNAYFCGATRTRNTTLTAAISAGATTANVASATGWAIGDTVVFATSNGTSTGQESRVLTSVNTVTGDIGWTSGTTYAHSISCPVGNFSSNVTVKAYNNTYTAYVCFRHTSSASNSRRELSNVSFQYCSSNTGLTNTQCFISCNSTTNITSPFRTFENCAFFESGNGTQLAVFTWNSGGFTITGNAFYNTTSNTSLFIANGTYCNFSDNVYYYSLNATLVNSGFSQGSQGCTLTNETYCSVAGNTLFNIAPACGLSMVNCKFHSVTAGNSLIILQSGDATFTGCDFGSSRLWGTPVVPYLFNTSAGAQVFNGLFTDCYFGTPSTATWNSLTIANPNYVVKLANKNADPLVQEIYKAAGVIVRDNTSKVSGVQSLKMSPVSATVPLTFTLKIPAPNGKKVGVSGYFWRDTANTTTATLSGMGITPSVYTASGSLSANEQFFVSGTQTTGNDGFFTLTISTTGTSGNLWVDAISAPQASAIDFGEFGYWYDGLPSQVVTSNFVSSLDVWNTLASNVTVSGSMGKLVKFIQTLLLDKA